MLNKFRNIGRGRNPGFGPAHAEIDISKSVINSIATLLLFIRIQQTH